MSKNELKYVPSITTKSLEYTMERNMPTLQKYILLSLEKKLSRTEI